MWGPASLCMSASPPRPPITDDRFPTQTPLTSGGLHLTPSFTIFKGFLLKDKHPDFIPGVCQKQSMITWNHLEETPETQEQLVDHVKPFRYACPQPSALTRTRWPLTVLPDTGAHATRRRQSGEVRAGFIITCRTCDSPLIFTFHLSVKSRSGIALKSLQTCTPLTFIWPTNALIPPSWSHSLSLRTHDSIKHGFPNNTYLYGCGSAQRQCRSCPKNIQSFGGFFLFSFHCGSSEAFATVADHN